MKTQKPNLMDAVQQIAHSTPRQAVDRLRAIQLTQEILVDSGQLVWRHQVEHATARLWEIVGNDLRYTLPGEVADRMTNKADAAAVRIATREAVEIMIESWKKAGAPAKA